MLTYDHERSKIILPPTNTSDVKTTLPFKRLKVISLKLNHYGNQIIMQK